MYLEDCLRLVYAMVRHRVAISSAMTSNPVDGPRFTIPVANARKAPPTAACVRVPKGSCSRLHVPGIVVLGHLMSHGLVASAVPGQLAGCQCHLRPAMLANQLLQDAAACPMTPLGQEVPYPRPTSQRKHSKQSPTPRVDRWAKTVRPE